MLTVSDIENYYKQLEKSLNNNNHPTLQYNNDRSHNSTVLRFMMDNSSSIKMYCGQLSVFRTDFYEKIQESESEDLSKHLTTKLNSSFKQFIQKTYTTLTIVFESFKKEYLKDLICNDDFFFGIKNNKIHLLKLNDNLTLKRQINHFSFSDSNIVRLEQDKEKHSAICSLNQSDISNLAKETFDKIISIAEKIPYSSLR